jgi:glycosyltransferase involved in cell wall biosynthesis
MIYILGSRGIPARYGGFETLAERLAIGLAERGEEVRVIGTRDSSSRNSISGYLVTRRPFQSLETPLLTWTTRPKVTSDDSVLVLNPINVWTAKRLAHHGASVWLHMDGMEHQRMKWGPLARFAHRTARRSAARSNLGLVVDSYEIAKVLLDEFGARSTVIGYGGCPIAESDPHHRWTPNGSLNSYLVVARPEPENNILQICRAFNQAKINANLTVVGAPDQPTKYWKTVQAEAAKNPRILLLPGIWDRDKLCDLYRTCTAVVHGHSAGGTNPSLVDALSHNCPILAHDNPFNRETASTAAEYWPDEEQLTTALMRLINTPAKNRESSREFLLNWVPVVARYWLILARS